MCSPRHHYCFLADCAEESYRAQAWVILSAVAVVVAACSAKGCVACADCRFALVRSGGPFALACSCGRFEGRSSGLAVRTCWLALVFWRRVVVVGRSWRLAGLLGVRGSCSFEG